MYKVCRLFFWSNETKISIRLRPLPPYIVNILLTLILYQILKYIVSKFGPAVLLSDFNNYYCCKIIIFNNI